LEHRALELLNGTYHLGGSGKALVGLDQRQRRAAGVLKGEEHLGRLTVDLAQGGTVAKRRAPPTALPGADQALGHT
jgi:hypothetical protein